ncbi:MAG: tetratricopeptide repeat protein, partial [Bdellovibrionales bacterium]|nr:tetratricopeptide repeat protein [Bdellovibrionales bacterium]
MMRGGWRFLLGSLLALGLSTVVQAQVAQLISLEKMRQDLAKINKSIDETEAKVKDVRDARFLPDLYFALAEFLVEKARYMYAIKIAENKGTPMDELDFNMEKRPKFRAIEIYDILIDKFPKLPERDKAIFFKAHELRELGRLEDMVRAYAQLTREYPKSAFWEESQLVIGDYFFEEKKDVDLALEMYTKILKRPVGPFTPLAHYKIG